MRYLIPNLHLVPSHTRIGSKYLYNRMARSNAKSAEQLKDFNYFTAILSKRSSTIYDKIHFRYQRGIVKC
ncbi:uncharacterized protein LAJ45_04689 [Morchella importuna]|uniref:uncharacterized protein n=1 Tax=Morchella importuna TaxID=1174673 RepID=UPI001E8DD8D0|nr:uncharacterized protein LAJ45_04689 [Morchella importuna]KAH8151484.1 hypothetical protein LAJ45_04689 [Morchella importuna]